MKKETLNALDECLDFLRNLSGEELKSFQKEADLINEKFADKVYQDFTPLNFSEETSENFSTCSMYNNESFSGQYLSNNKAVVNWYFAA